MYLRYLFFENKTSLL